MKFIVVEDKCYLFSAFRMKKSKTDFFSKPEEQQIISMEKNVNKIFIFYTIIKRFKKRI